MKNTSSRLSQYTISLSLKGIQYDRNIDALQLISNELAMRSHLECLSIVREFGEIKAWIVAWGLTKEITAKQTAEELFEIASSVLAHPEGVSVHVERMEKHNHEKE